jgi:hypothetical protein
MEVFHVRRAADQQPKGCRESGYGGGSESAEMTVTLNELKEAGPWVKIPPNTFLFNVLIPGGVDQWSITIEGSVWRVRCDEPERIFANEDAACNYFWDRLQTPPSN